MAGVGGAAVPGRLSLAGTEARPTGLFSSKIAIKPVAQGVSPVQAQAKHCGKNPIHDKFKIYEKSV